MMGFFSNLFAKQNCAVCGKECGTLHRSKLRDGQFLCDDCGNKCSKYIRLSELTLDEAKEHMEYMARMKRVFDEVFDKTGFRVNAYPSTPTQMGLVFCDELGMLYIDDRTGGRGKMPELIRYDQIASYEEYLDETPAKEPGQKPTLNGGGLKLKLVQPRGITDTFDVYCYDLNSSDPEEPGDALDYWGSCYSSKDRDLTVIYWTNSAPVLVQDGEYAELILEGDNEIGPFCSMPSLNLSGDELLTVGELESSGDDYFAAFDLDGNELARSSQPVGSFDAVMMKRPNGYLLDTGYVWELYAPDGTFLKKSLPVGERETLCQLCGEFCTFDVFLPLEENAFLAVGHYGKATEPDEPVVFRITTDF